MAFNPEPGKTPSDVLTFRPALRSMWFLFFGLLLGPAIVILGRDPEGGLLKWAGLSAICLGLILHRLGLRYTLDQKRLTADSWWGRGRSEAVTLAFLRKVEVRTGLAGRLTGCGHLEVESEAFDEGGLSLLGQPRPGELAGEIERRAARARKERGHGPAD